MRRRLRKLLVVRLDKVVGDVCLWEWLLLEEGMESTLKRNIGQPVEPSRDFLRGKSVWLRMGLCMSGNSFAKDISA
jgi:hypothetical protein